MGILEKALEYAKRINSDEVFNTLYPHTDSTCGEVCQEDFIAGYTQCLKDSKAPEMLEILIKAKQVLEDAGFKVEKLIKEATEL